MSSVYGRFIFAIRIKQLCRFEALSAILEDQPIEAKRAHQADDLTERREGIGVTGACSIDICESSALLANHSSPTYSDIGVTDPSIGYCQPSERYVH